MTRTLALLALAAAYGRGARAGRNVDGAVFTTGENVIAALVKQSTGSSSDLSFDLQLTVLVERELLGPDAAIGDGDGGTTQRDGAAPDVDGGPPTDGGGDGCGCHVASAREVPGGLLVVGLALLGLLRRRAFGV